ncbi:MAG: heavy metal translocating P-type ATPase [Peptococcaceae bacterium]|nr:heavy metal translocating P-type ATPase [Peptococcaceae bacterium]
MKATLLHESRGRLRLRLGSKPLRMADADRLARWLEAQPAITEVTLFERTAGVIIRYEGDRRAVIDAIARFRWQDAETEAPLPASTARAINRQFREKLVGKVLVRIGCRLFLPRPLRLLKLVRHMLPFMRRGFACLRQRRLNVELLDALSIGISVARRDFGTAGMVMFLLEIGELLEEWTHKKSIADLAQSMSLHVDRVWVRGDNQLDVLTPISQVQPGDTIVVRAGGIIPLDGTVIAGEATVNQASLTGESLPVPKHADSVVYAGTIVEEGECLIVVKEASGGSRYDQIVAMIEQSERLKSASEAKASHLADKLVPYTFLGSLAALALTRSPARALSVLMVDFSCALKLAMPLAVLSAIREAAKNHITVKGGKFLETLAHADTIVFDKTGTLTHACPQVVEVVPFGGHEENEMLRLAACLEEHFPHSMANAVVAEAKQRGLNHDEYHSKVDYIVAHGIASTVGEDRVLIGSRHFIFDDEGIILPAGERARFDALSPQYSHLYLAIAGELAAVICIADPLRQEAQAVLAALKALGITRTVMLTGDSQRTAAAIAAEAGVDAFCAEMLPADKARFVAEQRAAGHTVIMVGDGINDSPALSEADCGIAISDGAAIAREIADVTIAADSLWELVTLRRIASALMGRIQSNYRFVIGFNGALIALGLTGILAPATSATLHNLSTLGVSLRSMRPLTHPAPTPQTTASGACARQALS